MPVPLSVVLRPTSSPTPELAPAADVARLVLAANDKVLWRRVGLLLLTLTDRRKYSESKLRCLLNDLPGELVDALDAMYDTNDREILERRRGRVLEILTEKKIFRKYPDDSDHIKKAGDVEVVINGVTQGPGNLDVCVWAACAAQSGEFYDCKSGAWQADWLNGKVRLLNKIFNALYQPERNASSIVGFVSYQNETFLKDKISECDYPQHISVIGFSSLFSADRGKAVCNCRDRYPAREP